jgi:hypothetical protein
VATRKQVENPSGVLFSDANSVIADMDHRPARVATGSDADLRSFPARREFQSIADEVVEQDVHLIRIAADMKVRLNPNQYALEIWRANRVTLEDVRTKRTQVNVCALQRGMVVESFDSIDDTLRFGRSAVDSIQPVTQPRCISALNVTAEFFSEDGDACQPALDLVHDSREAQRFTIRTGGAI